MASTQAPTTGSGEALMDGPDIRRPPPGDMTANGAPGFPRKKKRPVFDFARSLLLLFLRVKLLEDELAVVHIVNHVIQRADDCPWIHVAVYGKRESRLRSRIRLS